MKDFFVKFLDFNNLTWRHWVVIFVAYLVLHVHIVLNAPNNTNLSVYQAKAFLDGRLHIQDYYWDASLYQDKYYVSFPPFPAVLVTPVVALFGNINSVLFSIILTFLSMYLLYRILQQLIPKSNFVLWIFLGFFFGTPYWYTLITSHHVNGFAHIVCIAALLLFFFEILNSRRPVLLGLYLAAAFLSRQMTVFYGIILIYYFLIEEENKLQGLKKLAIAGLVFTIPVCAYLMLNYFRFGNALDTGYAHLEYAGFIKARVDSYGLFSYRYFTFNFYNMFVKGHNLFFGGPDQLQITGIDLFGTSLLAASPFVFFAVKTTVKKPMRLFYWITAGFIIVSLLFYHNNGWMQVNGHRFTLDFIPVLIILLASACQNIPLWLFRSLVIYSVALNAISFFIHAAYR